MIIVHALIVPQRVLRFKDSPPPIFKTQNVLRFKDSPPIFKTQNVLRFLFLKGVSAKKKGVKNVIIPQVALKVNINLIIWSTDIIR